MESVPCPRDPMQRLFFPVPGVPPPISRDALIERGLLATAAAAPLRGIREHSALAFDFILKRTVASRGHRFATCVFAPRPFFVSAA